MMNAGFAAGELVTALRTMQSDSSLADSIAALYFWNASTWSPPRIEFINNRVWLHSRDQWDRHQLRKQFSKSDNPWESQASMGYTHGSTTAKRSMSKEASTPQPESVERPWRIVAYSQWPKIVSPILETWNEVLLKAVGIVSICDDRVCGSKERWC